MQKDVRSGVKLAFTFAGGYRRSVSIANTNWHHIAVVARNGDANPTFCVDGAVTPLTDSGGAATINLYASTEPLHIGAQVDSVSGWYYYSSAVVDEVSLYINALSADQIQAIYQAGAGGKCNIPAVWLEYYFGPDYQNHPYAGVTVDADGDGVSNLQEYFAGTDPNRIRFSLSVTNQYVTNTAAPVQLNITGGVPSYIAVLVNTTNESWQAFSTSTLSVPTPTDGVYVVTVGLCGWAPTAARTWQTVTLFRDTTPLGLVLTNLPALSGSRPFIDPAGYTTRAVSSLTWTLIDANGNTNSGNGAVVRQGWSLSDPFHTTNWFQCVDLPLALGTNSISIRAVDWVGSVAVTNFAYIFDTNGDSTPPSLTLLWPQDASQVSGNSFIVQARTDDDTAAVALQYTDANGMVQTVNGLIERGGNMWVPSVPLVAGTNRVSLTATDAAGNMSTNNFTVVQNSVALTVSPVSQRLLQYCSAPVSVTVGAAASAVTVNGLPGTSADGLYWTVESVPLPPGGTVTLQASAQLTDGTTLQTVLTQERDPIVFVQTYGFKLDYSDVFDAIGKVVLATETHHTDFHWERGVGGTNLQTHYGNYFDPPLSFSNVTRTVWPPDNGYLPSLAGQQVYLYYEDGQLLSSSTTSVALPSLQWMERSSTAGVLGGDFPVPYSESSGREVKLFTGGSALRQRQALFDLSASLTCESEVISSLVEWASMDGSTPFLQSADPPVAVPPEQTTLGGEGHLGSDGHLWTVDADGQEIGTTEQAPQTSYNGQLPGQQKYKLRINWDNGSGDITDTNVTAFVGQRITLTCDLVGAPGSSPPPITNYEWTVPGSALTNFYISPDSLQTNGYPVPLTEKTTNTVRFCWVDPGSKSVRCKVKAISNEWSAQTWFHVKRPNATLTATVQTDVEVWNDMLRFGNNAFAGITFMPRNMDTPGDWQYIQVGHQLARYQTAGTNTWSRAEGRGLDTVYPNPNDRDAPWTILPSDATVTTVTGTYTTYLAFRPTPADILVPIREITWSWDGQAATNGSGQWVGGGSGHVDPHDLEAPPTISWTNNIMSTLTNRIPEN